MSKCRYNLTKECHDKDCVVCVIEDIKADLDKRYDEVKPYDIQYASGLEEALEIIERHCGGENE